MAEIRLQNLAHSYSRTPSSAAEYAIREMNHTWEQGGAYALLGPSGCGKSTLLNIISGLLSPSHGQVLFDSRVVNDLTPQMRNIAQVFQFPVVYDTMTVFDNLAFPLRNQGMAEPQVLSKVHEIAEVLDLHPLLTKKASNLSADEKQKVSMGRGLVRDDVSAILFDEPLTVIDPHLKWKLRRKLKQIHEQFNITMIYVTHDQLEASTFADKIAVMYGGQIVQFGTPRELFERPSHTFVGYFIGSPGMNLIEVERCADGVCFANTRLSLGAALNQRLDSLDYQQLKIGIRPEFVHLWDLPGSDLPGAESLVEVAADSDAFSAEVVHVEDLGTYKILSLNLDGQPLKVRLQEDQVVPRHRASVSFPAQWLMVYADDFLVTVDAQEARHESA
ncbi:ABC transporter ATP-binding protein [Pseudomonas sp. S9]|uniref:ABC transporter ATP-binding protein n=1 Tax=Pseudomonas sp. S9 TaxID=686578 RepID=UPI0002556E76|nr:ABC transporter ATP-binding protein [Pseudomonas sp. S9]